MANNHNGQREHKRQRQQFDCKRLEALGWRPIEEADYPHSPCFLRLGLGAYTIGFGTEDGVWLCARDMVPVQPTHFKDYPD